MGNCASSTTTTEVIPLHGKAGGTGTDTPNAAAMGSVRVSLIAPAKTEADYTRAVPCAMDEEAQREKAVKMDACYMHALHHANAKQLLRDEARAEVQGIMAALNAEREEAQADAKSEVRPSLMGKIGAESGSAQPDALNSEEVEVATAKPEEERNSSKEA